MKLRIAMISILALISLASADVLWDQSTFDPWGAGFFNSESGEPPFGITMHAVNDVTVDGGGWVINTITTYYSGLDFAWGYGIFEGYLHVYPISDVYPVEDPTLDTVVPMTGTWGGDHWIVKAEGLSLNLTPGSYWVGITPIAPGGMWGPEIHLSTDTLVGADTAVYDPFGMPPAWFSFNPGVDASILIEGEWSVATEDASWSSIKALY
jgi:hypothetical protein